jgi:hypothetical protein
MIEIEPLGVVYRPKGTQQRVRLPHAAIYEMACRAYADANKKRRKKSFRRGAMALKG